MIKGLSVPAWYAKVIESEEPAINPFDFWGATKKTKKYSKKAKLKTKRTASPNNGWAGYDVPAEEVEDMTEVVVVEHNCGFGELITLVNNLESEIKGLDLGNDLGIRRLE
ncbi:hypothetical protein NUW58_g7620 [Xylaria curta]|uniref:Uncharacterized protein n=1 Tax=Xylaria curta TaxID=42375 RepID=A0ACC1NHZ7_9PEZI|nr:hypothetical protein NUW58_g7620 [Xylaria curta]